jgi:hypothetical protein
VAEGRVGLSVTIGQFVVAEDRSLGARIDRWRLRGFWRWKRLRVRLRQQVQRLNAMQERAGLKAFAARLRGMLIPMREGFRSLGHAALLLSLIMRYAFGRPLHASEVEKPERGRYRKAFIILGLSLVALAFALLLPERDVLSPEPMVATAVASIPAATSPPEAAAPEARRGPEAALPPEQRPWQPVRQPMALYHLESPELTGLALNYRVSQRGTSRQDTLIWQPRAEAAEAELRRSAALIVIERHEGNAPTEKPLFAELASRAAEHRLVVERMAAPQDIRTKFGPMEAAEVTLRQENGALPCLAFRRIDMTGVTLVGWLCGHAQRPVDRVSMSCFVDRLDLIGGGRDQNLRKFFAEAERSRQNCPSSRQPGRKMTWMDHEAPVPALKLTARR